MPRYTVSRKKFPVEQKFKGTQEHQSRVEAMAEDEGVSLQETIRRSIDYRYELFFLAKRSVRRSDRLGEPQPARQEST
jgi:hypothetical protein